MNSVRLTIKNENTRFNNSVGNWITFLNDLYNEYTQDTRLYDIKNRLLAEYREPTFRELLIIIEVLKSQYIANSVDISFIEKLNNNYHQENALASLNNALLDIINGLVNGGVGYTTELQTRLDYATFLGYDLPDEAQRIKENNAIINAKSSGIWDLWDIFYGMTANINYATLNWKDPEQFQLTLVNSPTWDATNGFVGNGTTSYVSTNWAPDDGINFTQDNAGIFGWSTTSIDGTSSLFGSTHDASSTRGTYIAPRSELGNAGYRMNMSSTQSFAVASSMGRIFIQRTTSNFNRLLIDNIQIGTSTVVSVALNSRAIPLLARDTGGTIGGFRAGGIKTFWAGASLNGLESTMDTIIQSIYA